MEPFGDLRLYFFTCALLSAVVEWEQYVPRPEALLAKNKIEHSLIGGVLIGGFLLLLRYWLKS